MKTYHVTISVRVQETDADWKAPRADVDIELDVLEKHINEIETGNIIRLAIPAAFQQLMNKITAKENEAE